MPRRLQALVGEEKLRATLKEFVPQVQPPQPTQTPSDDDVQVVGERSREQRNAEGRKRAIDLEDASRPAGKRRASEASEASPEGCEAIGVEVLDEEALEEEVSLAALEVRVASVRSRFMVAQEACVTELLTDSFGALVRGEIDNETFIARKEVAVARATQEKADPKLDELLLAFDELGQATQAVRAARAK
eukprot:2366652-Prymnesium_polylepis.1